MDSPTFGHYVEIKPLGQVENVELYTAFDPVGQRPVAIRRYQSPRPVAAEALVQPQQQQRIQTLTGLRHPYLAQIYEVGLAAGQLFIVLEDVGRETLADQLARRRAQGDLGSLPEVSWQVDRIGQGLDYAHAQGVRHGSLTPANILLNDLAEPALTDFGLTQILGDALRQPAYTSPEQAAGQVGNAQSDVYALGVILYELVTSHPPFSADSAEGILAHQRDSHPPSPSTFYPALPPAAEQVILKALAKDPNERFATAAELAAAFRGALAEPGSDEQVPDQSAPMPARIGRFEIEANLGQRGHLTVYSAYDPNLERQVAIKILPAHFAADSQLQAQFQREVELIVTVTHRAIVQVYDFGLHEGQPFVVMPLMAGGTLEARLKRGPLTLQQLIPMLERLAQALDEVHGQGIVHGQVKPSNILFDEQGQAYLSDFALSTIAQSSGPKEPSTYLSPEQERARTSGEAVPIDGRSDIFTLGVLLFEGLTGTVPPPEPVPRLHGLDPDLSETLQPIINQALAKAPAQRYATAGELVRHLREAASGRWYVPEAAPLAAPVQKPPGSGAEDVVDFSIWKPTATQQHLGRYQVEQEVGRGSRAVVYLAHDPHLARRVAIKVLPRQLTTLPRFQERFRHEMERIAKLGHWAIVKIYDFGEHEGYPFIVMPYLPGNTLAGRLQQGPLPLKDVAPVIERVAAALDEAHSQQIIHHNVKPSNIIFDANDEAHLSDFDIAIVLQARVELTGGAGAGFAPDYISPERVIAFRDQTPTEIDGRSDIYSLGIVLFEALTGQVPFRANSPSATATAHVQAAVPRIQAINPDLPTSCQEIIDRALAKARSDRYRTAKALAQDLNELATRRWNLGDLLRSVRKKR